MEDPKHIAIIMDGNRRFAQKNNIPLLKGHEAGAKKIEEVMEWCNESGIRALTLYSFSTQNFNRPKEEVDYLMNLFRLNFKRLCDDKRIEKNQIRINVIGRISMFPEDIQKSMRYIMDKTSQNNGFTLNFAMGYGGREEIVDATKTIIKKYQLGEIIPDEIDIELMNKHMYLQDEPDIVIRPGGEKRGSNFLIWQTWYSEWIFLDKMWPEITKADFLACLAEYRERKRRFGT